LEHPITSRLRFREKVKWYIYVVGYTETVDWWSMGVILFEMLVGYPPFASETPRETWYKIQNWRKYLVIPHDAKVSIQAVDLIRYQSHESES
jgi:serine/threonine protein kinase